MKKCLSLFILAASSTLFGMEETARRSLQSLLDNGTVTLKDRVKLVEKDGRTYRILDLSNLGLTSIEGLEKLEGIERINLSRNNLTEIPADLITMYPNLIGLNVSRNNLTHLPQEIGALKKLEFLSASYNSLATLPESCAHLTALRNLNLSHNCLSGFQESLFKQLTALRMLKINSTNTRNTKRRPELAPEVALSAVDKAKVKALFEVKFATLLGARLKV